MCLGRDVHGWIRQLDTSPSTLWSVEVYVSRDPHQGATVVFGYIEVHVNAMFLIYTGAYTHKYIGHEIGNWWGWDGRRLDHCRRCGWGVVGTLVLAVIGGSIYVRQGRDPTLRWI